MTTFRPFGPSVTLTACDIVVRPRKSAARPSSLNSSCLGMPTFLSSVREWLTAAVLVVLLLDAPDEHAVVERTQFRPRCLGHRAARSAVRDRPQLRRGCLSHGASASLVFQVWGERGW